VNFIRCENIYSWRQKYTEIEIYEILHSNLKILLLHCYIFMNLIHFLDGLCGLRICLSFCFLFHPSVGMFHLLKYLVILSGRLCWKSSCKVWNVFIMDCVLICILGKDHTITAQLIDGLGYYVHIIYSYMFQSFGLSWEKHNWSMSFGKHGRFWH
jgi:hypothetical protein